MKPCVANIKIKMFQPIPNKNRNGLSHTEWDFFEGAYSAPEIKIQVVLCAGGGAYKSP